MADTNQTDSQGSLSDREMVERTGREGEVTGKEAKSFKSDDKIAGANDLTGPAGDPAEGKRK